MLQEQSVVHEHFDSVCGCVFAAVCVRRPRVALLYWISVVQQECDGVVQKIWKKLLGFSL